VQTQELKDLWERLERVRADLMSLLDGVGDEALAWAPPGVKNPPAVIARHLAGAESYWIGEVAGGRPANRDRASEFSRPLWSRTWLVEALTQSRAVSEQVFRGLTGAALDEAAGASLRFRPASAPAMLTRRWAILHALEHESYHLGQLSVLLRLQPEGGVGA